MKIVFCTTTYDAVANGPTLFAHHLLEINQRYPDCEVRILTEDTTRRTNLFHESDFVYKVNVNLTWWTHSWGFVYRMFPYYKACIRLYPYFKYDVVVFNNSITGIWAALWLKIPVVGMINDDTNCTNSLQEFRWKKDWFKKRIFRYCEKLACLIQSGIICNSNYLYSSLIKEYAIPSYRLHKLYKGISVAVPAPLPRKTFSVPVAILFIKSDYQRGGLQDLMDALTMLPEYAFILRVAGPPAATGRHFPDIPQHVSVEWLGSIPRNGIAQLYQISDLFIVPSRKEALGIGNMEALLYGVTVISTQVGGIPEVLDRGNNGWLIKANAPRDLARCIKEVVENPGEANNRRQNGYRFVTTRFSHVTMLQEFIQILKIYTENQYVK